MEKRPRRFGIKKIVEYWRRGKNVEAAREAFSGKKLTADEKRWDHAIDVFIADEGVHVSGCGCSYCHTKAHTIATIRNVFFSHPVIPSEQVLLFKQLARMDSQLKPEIRVR